MKIDWSKLPRIAGMRSGSSRAAICGNLISAVRVETAADCEFDGRTHWHDNEQLLVMVSGEATVRIEGVDHVVAPGDLLFFPAGSRHAAVGVGPEGCTYYEIFAPARPDQLPGWVGKGVLRFD
jgi:quercetin dioxygenase-like cupin family protein